MRRVNKESLEWKEARKITHHWLGSEEHVYIDVTERVMDALNAARFGSPEPKK